MEHFDWAKAIYELALDRSPTIQGVLESAGLKPEVGDLTDVDLSKLDLSGQDLSGWDLREANFAGAILSGTDLRSAKIVPRDLLKANDWQHAKLDDELRSDAMRLSSELRPEFDAVLFKKVDELELSVRGANTLKNTNIVYIGDLIQLTEAEVLRIPSSGVKVLNNIKEILAGMGLHLGMVLANWPPDNIDELAKRFEDQY